MERKWWTLLASCLLPELAKLADMYPAEAERLRIPASVRAIDDRLRGSASVTV